MSFPVAMYSFQSRKQRNSIAYGASETRSNKKMHFHFPVCESQLHDIIEYVLSECNTLSAFGFNSGENEFWAKQIRKNEYTLFVTMSLRSGPKLGSGFASSLLLSILAGKTEEVAKLIETITHIVELHTA